MGIIRWLGQLLGLAEPDSEPLGPECESTVEELLDTLQALIDVLSADGEVHWTAWMERSRVHLEERNYRGVEHLLNAYGGMGSFNDLVIGQHSNGDSLEWADNAASMNNTLDALRSEAYASACRLKELHRGDH